jgi:streptogramin lyase
MRRLILFAALLSVGCSSHSSVPAPHDVAPQIFQKQPLTNGVWAITPLHDGAGPLVSDAANHKVWALGGNRQGSQLIKVAMDQKITRYPISISTTGGFTIGPDQNFWISGFTPTLSNAVARVTPGGVETDFALSTDPNLTPGALIAGPDGALWFGECGPYQQSGAIGRVDMQGNYTQFPAGCIYAPTVGPDGNIWYIDGPNVVSMTTKGAIVGQYPIGIQGVWDMITGTDGKMYAIAIAGAGPRLVSITTSGVVTDLGDLDGLAGFSVVNGPDGNLWIASYNRLLMFSLQTLQVESIIRCKQCEAHHLISGPDNNIWEGTRSGLATYVLQAITASPDQVTVAVGKSATVAVSETNYAGQWTAATPNPPKVSFNTTSQNGTFTITGLAPGATYVTIYDSKFNSVKVKVTVTQ